MHRYPSGHKIWKNMKKKLVTCKTMWIKIARNILAICPPGTHNVHIIVKQDEAFIPPEISSGFVPVILKMTLIQNASSVLNFWMRGVFNITRTRPGLRSPTKKHCSSEIYLNCSTSAAMGEVPFHSIYSISILKWHSNRFRFAITVVRKDLALLITGNLAAVLHIQRWQTLPPTSGRRCRLFSHVSVWTWD